MMRPVDHSPSGCPGLVGFFLVPGARDYILHASKENFWHCRDGEVLDETLRDLLLVFLRGILSTWSSGWHRFVQPSPVANVLEMGLDML